MAVRFYLAPRTGTGSDLDPFRPQTISGLSVRWTALDYGREGSFLVAADVTAGQHATIIADVTIAAFPQNLDGQVGVNLATVQAALETRLLPGEWVLATHTYRQVLYGIATICLFAQRFAGLHKLAIFGGTITLDTTLGSLTQTQRDRLRDVADSFNLDYSQATGATTIRQVLRYVARQLPAMSILGEATTWA